METLILKLNATGDVVRTTTLLNRLPGAVTWITAAGNVDVLPVRPTLRRMTWDDREAALDREYDLVINLEDEIDQAAFAARVRSRRQFGAYLTDAGTLSYSEDARTWFDMSLISVHGRVQADALKLRNRRTYQELLFEGLGWQFADDPYLLPMPTPTDLTGDVAIAPVAGPVWPMKGWPYYDELQRVLEARGYTVNVLPRRPTLQEHLGDIAAHRCLVSGDSLPMHLALGVGLSCVTIFNCTSPWEIHGYGRQTQLVSPLLEQYFYKRGYEEAATTAITLEQVLSAVVEQLEGTVAMSAQSSGAGSAGPR